MFHLCAEAAEIAYTQTLAEQDISVKKTQEIKHPKVRELGLGRGSSQIWAGDIPICKFPQAQALKVRCRKGKEEYRDLLSGAA